MTFGRPSPAQIERDRAWRRRSAQTWEAKRRTARHENRATLRSKRGPKPMSPARREDEQRRRSAYAIVKRRAAGLCEANADVACTGRHEHTHHKQRRSATSVRNENRHDPELLLAVCLPCHESIHAHPGVSYLHGWLIRRGAA